MPPKSKSKSSRQSTEPKLADIKRTLPENATTLEKENAEALDAKRCKIQRDVKKTCTRRSTTTSGASAATRSTSRSETASPFSTA